MYLSTSLSSHLSSPLPLRRQKLDVISFLKLNSWLWLLSSWRWRNYPQPGCHLVRYPPVVIIYQIHSDSGHYAETLIHTCSISLTEAWTGYSMFRTHLPECTPGNTSTWISNKILLTYKSLYAITPGTFQTFSAKRLLSFWVLGAVARTLWKHTPLSALKCLDYIFKKQLIKNCHVLTEAFDLGSLKCAI